MFFSCGLGNHVIFLNKLELTLIRLFQLFYRHNIIDLKATWESYTSTCELE